MGACFIFQGNDRDLCWREGEEEEEEGSEELASHDDEMVADCVARSGGPVP